MTDNQLFDLINSCAVKVKKTLGPGFVESVYQRALSIELTTAGLKSEMEVPIKVYYNNIVVGEFRADILVEDKVILELKAVSMLTIDHHKQLVNYLQATGIDHGVLINFGSKFIEIKHKYRTYTPTRKA